MTLLTGLLIGVNIGAVIGWYWCKKFKGDLFALLSYIDTRGRYCRTNDQGRTTVTSQGGNAHLTAAQEDEDEQE